ncbi:MAG: S-adenosylmethionine:tRNA ribosyltransferase-isomerase [Alistipes sp.]|jgi:S-adenosylmethionine:tRNA ribosyltransferase-isomerase|nr:S-adenosylmethionine:tRNA ribosyltransferase-isomerase [Alistipes sp.]
MNIADFDYDLPDERIARFPVGERDASRLLVWRGGDISETVFSNIGSELPAGSLLVFNNTRVVRARLVMHKVAPAANLKVGGPDSDRTDSAPATGTPASTPDSPQTTGTPATGARIELLCLEPAAPADYERAFAARGSCEWICMVGNLKKWSGTTTIVCGEGESELRANRKYPEQSGAEQRVRFEWDSDLTFGQLLESLGRVPIPPYLERDSEEIDNTRYQTVYAEVEGSVAAPTAGLHFTPRLIEELTQQGDERDNGVFRQSGADAAPTASRGDGDSTYSTAPSTRQGGVAGAPLSRKIELINITLHVGAGTFLPVKTENALEHPMHVEHFEVTLAAIERLIEKHGGIIAVGTTSVRTLESLAALGWRCAQTGSPDTERPVGQFEPYYIPAEFDGLMALEALAGWMRARGSRSLHASTQIMITPGLPLSRGASPTSDVPGAGGVQAAGFRFRMVRGIVTNFHQPRSTLLLLISAFTEGGRNADSRLITEVRPIDEWRRIYDYALGRGFRFLSYGDSSLLLR